MKPLLRDITATSVRVWLVACLAPLLSSCGGGGGGGAPGTGHQATAHQVTISWLINHERAVATDPGGGYIVEIPGQAPINCPVTGFSPPCLSATSVRVTLMTGQYDARVTAYSAFNAPGSTTGSRSAPSVIHVIVP